METGSSYSPNAGTVPPSRNTLHDDFDYYSALRACQECHRKKTKCDMRRPACGLCARTGTQCEFPVGRKRPTRSSTQGRTKVAKIDDQLSMLVRLLEGQIGERPVQEYISPHLSLAQNSDEQALCVTERPVLRGTPSPQSTNTQSSPGQGFQNLLNDAEGPFSTVLVSNELAQHLIDLYFDKVAPWLPLLHKPRFSRYYAENLGQGPDALANLPTEDVLTLLSMFSLSARYSSIDHYWTVPPLDRGHIYADEAKRVYAKVRTLQEPSLRYLQGCILLAYYCYNTGMSLQGWVLVGVCIHFAVDLGLSDLDDPNRTVELPADPIDQEELRRTWWAVWDLDTFGSIMLLRPFAVDRRHVTVKLPISDEAWFAGKQVDSPVLRWHKEVDWTALRASPNQDERAWYIVANGFAAQIFDKLLLRESISFEDQTVLENELSCLNLALPSKFHQRPGHMPVENGESANNFIIGTHIHIAAASYWIFVLSGLADDKPTATLDKANAGSSREQLRVAEMSAILRMWPPGGIPTAHPFLVASLCPVFGPPTKEMLSTPAYHSYDRLASLIQGRFGEHWELGQLCLRITRILQGRDISSSKDGAELARRYPIFLKPFLQRNRSPSVPRVGSSEPGNNLAFQTAATANVHNSGSVPNSITSPNPTADDNVFSFGMAESQFHFSDSFFNTPIP